MPMVVVVSLSILSVAAFYLKTKHLHLFEIMAIWFAVIAVNSPMYSYFLINKHWMSVPENKELAVIRIVYTEVLNPLIIAWVLDEVLGRKRHVRLAIYAATVGFLFLGGVALDKWGVIHFSSIGIWVYIPSKCISLIAALCAVGLVRYLSRKEGFGYGSISRD